MLPTNRILLPIKTCVRFSNSRIVFDIPVHFNSPAKSKTPPTVPVMVLITVGFECWGLSSFRIIFVRPLCDVRVRGRLSSWLFFVTLSKTGDSKSDEENNLEFYPFSPRLSQERSSFEIKTRSITRRLFYSARLDLLKKHARIPVRGTSTVKYGLAISRTVYIPLVFVVAVFPSHLNFAVVRFVRDQMPF